MKHIDRKDAIKKNNDILPKIPPPKKKKREKSYYPSYEEEMEEARSSKMTKFNHDDDDENDNNNNNNTNGYIGTFLLDFVQQKLDKCENLSERDRDLFIKLSNQFSMNNKNVQ